MRIEELFSQKPIEEIGGYLALAWRRYSGDKCMRVAASLSYTSLLAIVPCAPSRSPCSPPSRSSRGCANS